MDSWDTPCLRFRIVADHRKEDALPDARCAIHSGNAGDVLYSLPALRAADVRHLILNAYVSTDPLRKLTEQMAHRLAPLLLAQPYLDRVTIVSSGVPLELADEQSLGVDYILDQFRLQPIDRIHLLEAHARALGVSIDPNSSWLTLPEDLDVPRDEAVLAFTPRYRGLTDEKVRELCQEFDRVRILAIPDEWRVVSGLDGEVQECGDFLEMAQIIRGSSVFVGNPSLASAIAEGLKHPRMIDVPKELANAFPIGAKGYHLPESGAAMRNLLRKLTPETKRSRASLSELEHTAARLARENARLRQLLSDDQAETEAPTAPEISVLRDVPHAEIVLTGGAYTRLEPEANSLFLHPSTAGTPPATARFPLELSGQNAFEAVIEVSHSAAHEIEFLFHLQTAGGKLICEARRNLKAASLECWSLMFPSTFGAVTVELRTLMADGGSPADYAWAHYRSPRIFAL